LRQQLVQAETHVATVNEERVKLENKIAELEEKKSNFVFQLLMQEFS